MEGPNAAQIEYWNSSDRSRNWVDRAEQFDEMLAVWGELMLDAASIAPDGVVLDVGCGCGATTLDAASRAREGRALGIDVSDAMVARARERASEAGIANVRFTVDDAQTYPFKREFDAVTSRFGVMFFADPVAAFSNLRRALAPGGRIVFVCWQAFDRNPWMKLPYDAATRHVPPIELAGAGQPGPYSLAEEERLRGVLGDAGLSDVDLERVERTMLIGGSGGVDDAMQLLRGSSVGQMLRSDDDPEAARRADDAVREVFERHFVEGRGVEMPGAAWVVSARR